jgi:hypothetical protein
MTIDDVIAAAPAHRSIIGLLLVLLNLAVTVWIFREVTGQRDGRSVPAMLAPPLLGCWRALVACWRWLLLSLVDYWYVAAEICCHSADWPVRRSPPS